MHDVKQFVQRHKGTLKAATMLAVMGAVMLQEAHAGAGGGGTGGNDFDDIWNTLQGWIQGSLGHVIAGSMILVGIIGGIARQSLMAFALGIGGGLGLYYSPTIITTIMAGAIGATTAVPPGVLEFANGLGAAAGVM